MAGKHRLVGQERRRGRCWRACCQPDVVLFVNGLPLAVVELKNAADESATLWNAWQQLQTYKAEIASLFAISGGLAA